MDNQVFIDIVMRGLDSFDKLNRKINDLGKNTSTGAQGFSRVESRVSAARRQTEAYSKAVQKLEMDSLRLAQAQARLFQAQGQRDKAIQILQRELSLNSLTGLPVVRAQKQLVDLETNYKNSAHIGAVRGSNKEIGKMHDLSREAGYALEELSRGDAVEGLVQLGASFGAGGVAVTGFVLAVGAAAVGIAAITAAVTQNARELQSLSRETGLSTLSLQLLGAASAFAGEKLDKATNGYSAYLQKVADANNGNKELAQTFQNLGINAAQAAKDPEQSFIQLAKSISAIEDPVKRSAYATAIFGENGRSLIPIFDEVAKNQERLQKLIKETGAEMDDGLIDQANKASREFEELKIRGQGALNDIARGALPAVIDLLRDLNALLADSRPAWQAFGQFAREAIESVRDDLAVLRQIANLLTGDLQGVQDGIKAQALEYARRNAKSREEFREILRKESFSPIFGGGFTETEIYKLLEPDAPRPFIPADQRNKPGPSGLPNVPKKQSGKDPLAEKRRLAQEALRIDDQFAEVQFRKREQEARAVFERQRALLENEADLNENLYQRRAITVNDFYAEKDQLAQRSAQAEEVYLRNLLAIETARQARITATAGRRLAAVKPEDQANERKQIALEIQQAQLEIDRINRDLDAAKISAQQSQANLQRARTVEIEQLKREVAEIDAAILEETGNATEAAIRRARIEFQKLLADVEAVFGPDSTEAGIVRRAISRAETRGGAAENEDRARQVDLQFDYQKLRIQGDLIRGVITQRQARQELLELERAYAADVLPILQTQIEKYTELYGAQSEQVLRLQREMEQLNQLGIDTETATRRVGDAIQDGLVDTLERALTSINDAGEAFEDFGLSILRMIARIAAENIVDAIFGGKRGANGQNQRSGAGGFIDRIVGGIFGESDDASSLSNKLNTKIGGLFNKAFKFVGGFFSKLFGFGFDEGGFTGYGSSNLQPAGIVHANEFVFSAPAVASLGVGYLQNLHNIARRGYADGGLVTPIAAPNFGGAAAGSSRQQVVLFALGDKDIDDVLDEYGSDNVLIKRVSRNRKTLKALLNS